MPATPTDPETSRALSVWHRGPSHALSVLLVLTLTVAASTHLTRSSSTIATTSLPASTTTALSAAGDAIIDGLLLVKLQTLTQKLICPQYATLLLLPSIPIAVFSDSSITNILPRVSAVLVSMNSLIK
jgi:hypothetical protein